MVVIAIAVAAASMLVVLRQAYVPLSFRVELGRVVVDQPEGPAQVAGVAASPDGPWTPLRASDLVEDPDELPSYAAVRELFERQSRLRELLESPRVFVQVGPSERDLRTISFAPRPRRPSDLPLSFFAVLATAIGGFFVSGWVWALRQRAVSAAALAASGLGMLLTLSTANLVNTRALALDGSLLLALGRLNHLGGALFGAAMIVLFASYPIALVPRRWLRAIGIVCASWAALDFFRLWPSPLLGVYVPVAVETLAILTLLIVQVVRSWRNAADRAALGWMALSVSIGIGIYGALEPIPRLLGSSSPVSQVYPELVFLVIYAGIALGVLRYRLFDLGAWAVRGLVYMFAVLLLLACDSLLVFALHLDRAPSLGVSLLVVGFLYLPFRDAVLARASGRSQVDPALIEQALAVAFEPSTALQTTAWRALLARRFDALELVEAGEPPAEDAAPRVAADGLELVVPRVGSLSALRVRYPRRGRGLFNESDAALVQQLRVLLEKARAGREAYERGVAAERSRLAQDLHDDVGARIVSALHVADRRTRPILQAALADIRFLVGGLAGERTPITRLLAGLRREASDRCELAGVELDWPFPEEHEESVGYDVVKALLSATREGMNNVFHHARASRIAVRVEVAADAITLSLEDDGVGFRPDRGDGPSSKGGRGLVNMKERLERIGGSCSIQSEPGRTAIVLRAPIARGGETSRAAASPAPWETPSKLSPET